MAEDMQGAQPPLPVTEEDQRALKEMVGHPAKLLRIGSMAREMLEEVRRAPLDDDGRRRLRDVYERSVVELKEILSPELQEELTDVSPPFVDEVPSESELRISQAQLVGWLEGLFHGIQAALWAQHVAAQAQAARFPRKLLPPPAQGEGTGPYL